MSDCVKLSFLLLQIFIYFAALCCQQLLKS